MRTALIVSTIALIATACGGTEADIGVASDEVTSCTTSAATFQSYDTASNTYTTYSGHYTVTEAQQIYVGLTCGTGSLTLETGRQGLGIAVMSSVRSGTVTTRNGVTHMHFEMWPGAGTATADLPRNSIIEITFSSPVDPSAAGIAVDITNAFRARSRLQGG